MRFSDWEGGITSVRPPDDVMIVYSWPDQDVPNRDGHEPTDLEQNVSKVTIAGAIMMSVLHQQQGTLP